MTPPLPQSIAAVIIRSVPNVTRPLNIFLNKSCQNISWDGAIGSVFLTDNSPEYCVNAVREWLTRLGVRTRFIEPAVRGKMNTSRRAHTLRNGWDRS